MASQFANFANLSEQCGPLCFFSCFCLSALSIVPIHVSAQSNYFGPSSMGASLFARLAAAAASASSKAAIASLSLMVSSYGLLGQHQI